MPPKSKTESASSGGNTFFTAAPRQEQASPGELKSVAPITVNIATLMDELLKWVPAKRISDRAALGPDLTNHINNIVVEIRKFRAENPEKWENDIKLQTAKVSSEQLGNLAYFVMYTQDAKEMGALIRSTNSTFANILFREYSRELKNEDLKPFMQLVYKNFVAVPVPNIEKSIATMFKFTFNRDITEQQVQQLNLGKDISQPPTETIELPLSELREIFIKDLRQYESTLLSQAAVAAAAVTKSSFFSREKATPITAESVGFKRELPIVTACIKYLTSNNPVDNAAFMKLYTADNLSEKFRNKMDRFFVIEFEAKNLAQPSSSPKKLS
jgi:hypothetical protein